MSREIKIELIVTETYSNSNGDKRPILVRKFVTTDSEGNPKFFKPRRAIHDMLFKIVEWDYMTPGQMWWAFGNHPRFTETFLTTIMDYLKQWKLDDNMRLYNPDEEE